MNDEERGPWYLLTGIIVGIILGVTIAWVFQPVEYVDTSPASLRVDFKDQYRSLIAAAYASNGDMVRAKARLDLLGDEDVYRALSEQAQRTLAEEGATIEARALGLLAIDLGKDNPEGLQILTPTSGISTVATPPTKAFSPTPTLAPTLTGIPTSTPTPTYTLSPTPEMSGTPASSQGETSLTIAQEDPSTPTDTPIPRPSHTRTPTRTSTRTPGGPFVLLRREMVCDQELDEPLIQVEALDRKRQPVPGVLVVITWDEGEERFYTGLKPEKGPGYADFSPSPNVSYAVRLEEGGEPASDVQAVKCPNPNGEDFWGAWYLSFIQP